MNSDRSAYLFEDMSPEIPRKAYFPNTVSGMPRAYFGQGIGVGGNDYVSTTPFHSEQMEDARRRVANRFIMNGYNERLFSIGGARNMVPKPQPQGSFAMPLNLNGNQTYPVAGVVRGGGGSFRTDAGAAYGQQLLRQRAEQLNQLSAVVEDGAAVPSVRPPASAPTLDRDETDEIAFSLLLDDLQSAVVASEAQFGSMRGPNVQSLFSGTTADDFRRMFGLARKILLDLSRDDLVDYINRVSNLLNIYENAIESSELPGLIDEDVDLVGANEARTAALKRILPIYKTLSLLQFGVASLNLQPKARKLAMRTVIREIVKQRSAKGLDSITERMNQELQDRLNADADAAFAEMQQRNEEEDEDEVISGVSAAEASEEGQSAAGMSGVGAGEDEEEGTSSVLPSASTIRDSGLEILNAVRVFEETYPSESAELMDGLKVIVGRIIGTITPTTRADQIRVLSRTLRNLNTILGQLRDSGEEIDADNEDISGDYNELADELERFINMLGTLSGSGVGSKKGGYGASHSGRGKSGGSMNARIIGGAREFQGRSEAEFDRDTAKFLRDLQAGRISETQFRAGLTYYPAGLRHFGRSAEIAGFRGAVNAIYQSLIPSSVVVKNPDGSMVLGKPERRGKGRKKGGAMNELDMKIEQVSKMNNAARKSHPQGLAYGKSGRVTTKSGSSERTNTGMNDQRFDKRKGSNVTMVITQ